MAKAEAIFDRIMNKMEDHRHKILEKETSPYVTFEWSTADRATIMAACIIAEAITTREEEK